MPWPALFLIYVAVLVAMFVGAPFELISIASLIFFLIYLMVLVDLWILRLKQPRLERPFYAGGAFKVPVLAIVGFLLILAILVGNALQDPKIVTIGLPVAAACLMLALLAGWLQRRRAPNSGKAGS